MWDVRIILYIYYCIIFVYFEKNVWPNYAHYSSLSEIIPSKPLAHHLFHLTYFIVYTYYLCYIFFVVTSHTFHLQPMQWYSYIKRNIYYRYGFMILCILISTHNACVILHWVSKIVVDISVLTSISILFEYMSYYYDNSVYTYLMFILITYNLYFKQI